MRLRPYLALAGRIAATNLGGRPFPYKLTFAVTNRCNYRCRTCGIWRKKAVGELTAEEIAAFCRRSPRLSWVHLTGGEIFLRPDVVEIAAAIVRSSRSFLMLNFPTNGYLTDRIVEQVRRIAALGPQRLFITVSMDGDEALNDEIRGVAGGWRRQVETFRRLRELPGVHAALGMTLSPFNLREFPRAFAAAREAVPGLGFRDFHVNIVHASAYYGEAEVDLAAVDRPALAAEIERYRRLRGFRPDPTSVLEWAYLRRVGRYLASGRTPVPCFALRASCFLEPNGTVHPCSMWDRPLGNIRDHGYDLAPIWNAPATLEALREVREERCPHCWTPCEAYQSLLGRLPRLLF